MDTNPTGAGVVPAATLSAMMHFLPVASIQVARDARQRKKISTAGLKESIALRGVLNPIIVEPLPDGAWRLVAGERRLQSCVELGLALIPCRLTTDLPATELAIIELEENLKRSDLTWREVVEATGKLHTLYVSLDPEWSQAKTADALAINGGQLSAYLRVFSDLDNPKIKDASSFWAAYNLLTRIDQRYNDNALADILEAGSELFDQAAPEASSPTAAELALESGSDAAQSSLDGDLVRPSAHTIAGPAGSVHLGASSAGVVGPAGPVSPAVSPTPTPAPIIYADFAQWAASYSGPPFNFIHCDFPYGANMFGGKQGSSGVEAQYSDQQADYVGLIKALCANLDRVMSYSAHLMFWCSVQNIHQTIELFRKLAPSLVFNPVPLVWLKSDNAGIVSDPKRRPRHVYETALLASREDRLIVKVVADCYAAPTDKTLHVSTKPEPMLRHFFQMLVDQGTRMLDPTCGSGSALRAAESLGANTVLGIESNKEHAENALAALRKWRAMREASR